jgi:nucleoside-diphosphate-sugar epimerase
MERYVVPGPGGWIGSALLGVLARRLGSNWQRKVTCFGSQKRGLPHPAGDIEVRDLATVSAADVHDARVFHLAYLTKDKIGASSDDAFLRGNRAIDDYLLNALSEGRPSAVFVASSGAAQGVDQAETRNLYGVAKLLQEDRFLEYGVRSKTNMLVGRIFNISGPYNNKIENYALSSFLSQCIRSGRIEIDARQPVYRSYLDVEDLLNLVLYEMPHPGKCWRGPVDLCGPLVVELQDIAEAGARALGLDPSKIISRGKVDYDVVNRYLGDPAQARTLALKHQLRILAFQEQVTRTAAYLESKISHGSRSPAPG